MTGQDRFPDGGPPCVDCGLQQTRNPRDGTVDDPPLCKWCRVIRAAVERMTTRAKGDDDDTT